MNSTFGPGQTPSTRLGSIAAPAVTAIGREVGLLLRRPWMLWAMVLMVALMSAYVHLVHSQVERGERFRHGLAQASQSHSTATTPWLHNSDMPQLSPVAMDTGR